MPERGDGLLLADDGGEEHVDLDDETSGGKAGEKSGETRSVRLASESLHSREQYGEP
mgnify:FL=1